MGNMEQEDGLTKKKQMENSWDYFPFAFIFCIVLYLYHRTLLIVSKLSYPSDILECHS